MNWWELLGGIFIGAPVGALLRPHISWLERKARSSWNADPLIVHVEDNREIIWAGMPDWIGDAVYVDDPTRLRGDIPAAPGAWAEWTRSQNAVDAYQTQLKVTIQARVEAAVVIEGVIVKVRRAVPVTKGAILIRGVGGADVTPRHFSIDLDWGESPVVTWHKDGGETGKVPAMKLAAGDVEVFHIWAEARQPIRYEWTVELALLVEGRRVRRQIARDTGSPFVTVGGGDLDTWMNYSGSNEWQVTPPAV